MFRSLLRSSSGYLYNNIKNTINCQIIKVGTLNVIMNSPNSLYDHKMSAYVVLKSDKI